VRVLGDKTKENLDLAQYIDRKRYSGEFSSENLTQMRHLKTRMEKERIPKGRNPRYHIKLGPGTLSDIEWLVQLMQLKWMDEYPSLKSVSTFDLMKTMAVYGLLDNDSVSILYHTYTLCLDIRNALFLTTAKSQDILPQDFGVLSKIASIIGMKGSKKAYELENEYLRSTRNTRAIFEEHFYDSE
jgi:glutamate-ammonia-ligase adenylyltransferase